MSTVNKQTNTKHNLRMESWSYNKFSKLEPYIRNRDVEPRVSKVVKLLSKKYLPTHSIVTVGRATKAFSKYKKGDMFRLDGNTRADAFKVNADLIPTVPFHVIIIDIESKEEADEIYYSIDSSDSVETSANKNTGYLRERDYTATSMSVKNGNFKTAIDIACRYTFDDNGQLLDKAPFDKKLDYFWDELTYIDKWLPKSKKVKSKMSGSVVCGLLLIGKKYGVQNERFNLLLDNFKNEVTEINTATEADGVHYVLTTLYEKNSEVWTRITKNIPLITTIHYSLDKFMLGETINKRSGIPNTKKFSEKLMEFFQDYLS